MFCSTSLTESSTNSQEMSRQIVRNTKHNLLLGSNIVYFRLEMCVCVGGGGGSVGGWGWELRP